MIEANRELIHLQTRAWNGYGSGEERGTSYELLSVSYASSMLSTCLLLLPSAFKYLTPKIRLEADSLPGSLLYSRVFHMVCSGARCKQIVTSILDRRKHEAAALSATPSRPLFIWEPIPDLCTLAELEAFWEAARLVDVVSPNEGELSAYFGVQNMTDIVKSSGLTVADEVMRMGIGSAGKGMLVVRTGSRGCTTFSTEGSLQMRAYFLPNDSKASSNRVVDPTGGGNTFLGGLCKALVGDTSPSTEQIMQMINTDRNIKEGRETMKRKERIAAALVLANIAASYAIEQPGMPVLSYDAGKEAWNNEPFEDRVKAYIARERSHILEQQFF